MEPSALNPLRLGFFICGVEMAAPPSGTVGVDRGNLGAGPGPPAVLLSPDLPSEQLAEHPSCEVMLGGSWDPGQSMARRMVGTLASE